MTRNLLIVGIDPGTTTGVSVLDTQGKIVKVFSERNYGLNNIIKDLSDIGNVIIISTDKKAVPSFVKNLSIKIGARAISPSYDLTIKEKRDLVRNVRRINNDHERDSLAAALFAFDKFSPLFNKIEGQISDALLKDKVKEFVIKRETIAISTALDILTQPNTKENQIIKKIIDNKKIDPNSLKLIAKLKDAQKTITLLRISNNQYRNEMKKLKKPKFVNINQKIKNKDNTISYLNKEINCLKKSKNEEEKKVNSLLKILKKTNDFLIIDKEDTKILKNRIKPILEIDNKLIIDKNSMANSFIEDIIKGYRKERL